MTTKKKKQPAQDEDTLHVEASLATPKHETIVRKPGAHHAPAMRLHAKRLTDFAQAAQALCDAESLNNLLVIVIDIVMRQFSAFHVFCALREQPNGPMTYQAGKRRDGRKITLDDLQLREKIQQVIEKSQSIVLPRVSAQMEEKDRVRSAIMAPITRKTGCFGVIYADNAMVHEHYMLGDLDYLIFLAMHTGAILKKIP